MRLILVTGTNTDVGKTIATAAIVAVAMAAGRGVAVVKPVQTGALPEAPGDLATVQRLTDVTDVHEYARFEEPLAPGTAARRAGRRGPDVIDLAAHIHTLRDRDLVLVEGAGGMLVELNAAGDTLVELGAALARDLAVEVVLVASAGLGVLNIVAMTARVLRTAGLPLTGVVVGAWPGVPDLAARCNLTDLVRYARAPLVGVIPAGSGELSRDRFAQVARQSLGATLGGAFDAREFSSDQSATALGEPSR